MAGYNDSVKSANVITGILSNATLQGDSAYEVAVKNGYVGTEAEWLASLKGDKGDQGIQGPIGPTGPTGATGNGISNIAMGSSGWMSIHTTDGTDYSFYVKGDKGNKGDTGVGISTVLLNSDYTLTITLTDGDTYTTDPIRGAKGETGTGITDVELNSDYTLTITMSDGTSYTTGSIRGAKGDKGDTGSKGDKGTSISSVTKTGTSGLVDTYTITYDDGTTSTFTVTNGQNATVEVTSDTDSDYRLTFTDVNGSIETPNLYSDVTASAKQLLSDSYTIDQVPYLFRKSPDSDRAVEEIVGGTVGWNQLCNSASVTVTSGHKYYMAKGGAKSIGASTGTAITGLTSGTDIVTDLTTMFGSTIADYIYSLEQSTAGAGVSKLKEWGFFTEDYYEYSEPTLRSVEGLVRKKTVGFNQWDEEWGLGNISTSSGENTQSSNCIRSKNYIPVFPSTVYYGHSGGYAIRFFYYDAEKNYISYQDVPNTHLVTTPTDCYFVRFRTVSEYGTTYNHDICINLSDPTRNGQYEPYKSHTYLLDSSVVLRGVFKLDENNNLRADGDIYPSDGNGSRRYEEGQMTYQYLSSLSSDYIAYGNNTRLGNYVWVRNWNYQTAKARQSGGIGAICNAFVVHMHDSDIHSSQNRTYFEVGNIASLSDFLSRVQSLETNGSGLFIEYELATPTTFTAQPYHNPQIVGDTEEFVTTGIVPVGHSTKYFLDLRSRIEGLPDDFSTLIAPTEVTNKATKNYTKGELLIINNQLYKVTTAIANNGTITVNTNVRATTIAQEISPLVPPTTNGTYVLKATVSNGNVTYSWVAG